MVKFEEYMFYRETHQILEALRYPYLLNEVAKEPIDFVETVEKYKTLTPKQKELVRDSAHKLVQAEPEIEVKCEEIADTIEENPEEAKGLLRSTVDYLIKGLQLGLAGGAALGVGWAVSSIAWNAVGTIWNYIAMGLSKLIALVFPAAAPHVSLIAAGGLVVCYIVWRIIEKKKQKKQMPPQMPSLDKLSLA